MIRRTSRAAGRAMLAAALLYNCSCVAKIQPVVTSAASDRENDAIKDTVKANTQLIATPLAESTALKSCERGSTNQIAISTYEYKSLFSEPLGRLIHLRAYVVHPSAPKAANLKRPAIAFFHGGGWDSGNPLRWMGQAQYLAARGVVSVLFQYRLGSLHRSTRADAVADARSAIRWLRKNAGLLQVHPDKITAAGDSAGGHLALATSLVTAVSDEVGTDRQISSEPNGIFIAYPVVDLSTNTCGLETNLPTELKISPLQLGNPHFPMTMIVHGTEDACTRIEPSRQFCEHMNGNCTVIPFQGDGHAFLTYSAASYRRALSLLDQFLQTKNYLPKEPSLITERRIAEADAVCSDISPEIDNQRGKDWGYEDQEAEPTESGPRKGIW